jgi:hypothetical protein
MASTFSPSLRIELIGDGDQSGIWGQTTNTNLGTLIEQAIAGVVTITMVDANYTMTNFNGVSDEARNQVIVLTGTNNAQRNLIAPLVEKTYIIRNSTSGGFAVQVIGSSGTGVVIPNGVTTTVYCDGTNFFSALSGSVGNFTVNGNLGVTGTTALSGALTYGGVTLSNAVTGTGSMALSASPTFTGTPAGPTASPGTNTTQLATTAFVTAATGTLGTMSTQNANAVAITGGTITGITDLTVADGGTGASTFTANSVVLGNGTSSLAGNMVAPSTSGNLLVSNGTTWQSRSLASSGVKLGLGITGESWSSPSRSSGTTYTNSNAYPIMVNVTVQLTANGCNAQLIVGGVTVYRYGIAGFFSEGTLTAIVPPGTTYLVTVTNMNVIGWAELS